MSKLGTPTASKRESDQILRENAFYDLLDKMTADTEAWPDGSRDTFLVALHHVATRQPIPEWPDGMATFERRLLSDKLDRLIRIRPRELSV